MMSLTSEEFNNYIEKIKNKINELYDKINENEQIISSLEDILAKESAAINTKINSLEVKTTTNYIIPLDLLQNTYFSYNSLYGTLSKSVTKQLEFNLNKFSKYDVLKNVDIRVKFSNGKEISLLQDPSLINIFDARDGRVWSYALQTEDDTPITVSVEVTMPHKLINVDKVNSIEIKPFPIYSFKLKDIKLDTTVVVSGDDELIGNKKYNFNEQKVRKIINTFIVTPSNRVATFGLRNIYIEYEKINYNNAELSYVYSHTGNNVMRIEARDIFGVIIPIQWTVAVDPLFLETINVEDITGTVYLKGVLNNNLMINPQIKNIVIIKEAE